MWSRLAYWLNSSGNHTGTHILITPNACLTYCLCSALWCGLKTTTSTALHPFNGLFSRTTWVSLYQKDKTSMVLNEARDDGVFGWQWHQLDHMQTICISLQVVNHINTSSLNFYRPDTFPDAQPCQSTEGNCGLKTKKNQTNIKPVCLENLVWVLLVVLTLSVWRPSEGDQLSVMERFCYTSKVFEPGVKKWRNDGLDGKTNDREIDYISIEMRLWLCGETERRIL